MQKFLQFLMLTALFLPFALQAQNTLTVADGTQTNEFVPVYGYYADEYLRCQTIYPAEMIDEASETTGMTGGSITGLTYYLSTPASDSWGTASFVVKIKEVTATTLSSFVDMTDATTVYTGALDGTQSTMTVTFTTPYLYQGGNLLIEVYSTETGDWKRAYFSGVTASNASWQGYNSSSWSSVSGSNRNFIPKTTFTFTGGTTITCKRVQDLAINASQITSSSMTLTWTDSLNTGATYTVYDMADNSVIQSGITGTTYTATGLSANTEYTFGVEANCSASDASTVKIVTSRTACDAISVLPFTEDFEDVPNGSYPMPYCWNRYTSAFTTSSTYPYSYSSNAHSGSRILYFYGTTGDSYPDTMVAIAPEVDVTLYPMSANRVTFWARMGTASNTKKAYIGTMTNPADISTFTLVDSVTVSGNNYTLFSVPMTNATGAYAAIMVFKGSGTMYVDDFTIEEMPSCLEVSNLTVSGTTANSVTLTWTDNQNPDGTTYTVYNMADTSNVNAAITGNVAVIDNLSPNTNYTFGVQANCAAGDANFMTIDALTDCATESFPWSENFDNWSSKSPCWTFMSGAFSGNPTVSTSAWSLTSSSYGSDITLDGKAMTMNVYSTYRYWMVTPPIHITDNAALFSADVAVSAWSDLTPNYDADDTLAFALSTDGGSTFTTLLVLNNTQLNALSNTYTNLSVPVVGYTGQDVRFAIFAGSSAPGGDNRIAIDNVSVGVAPNCLPVTNLTASNTTASSVSLTWNDEVNSGATYTIYNMSDTTVIATGVSTTSYEVTGLTASTAYTFGVVANCSADEASSFAIVNATTDCEGGGCQIIITGADSYGDGWADDYGYVFSTITISQNGATIGTFSVETGYSNSESYSVCSSAPLSFSWTSNSEYDNEASFEIRDANNAVLYAVADGSTLTDGVFLTLNTPCSSCAVPGNLTLGSSTQTSATISWTGTATSYNVYNGTTFVANVTDTTYTFTGLTPGTSYVFGVVSVCSAADSSIMATVQMMTECEDVTTLPYYESFEGNLGCWMSVNGSSDGVDWMSFNCTNFQNADAHAGASVASSWSWSSTAMHADAWMISPKFVLPSTTDSLTFSWWEVTSSQYPDKYSVSLSTTTNDTAAFTTVLRPYAAAAGTWTIQTADLTAYAGQSVYIAFHHVDYDENYLFIDDISLFQGGYVPPAPDTLTVTFEVDNPAMGTTIPAPGTYYYVDGDTIHFGSQANPGYHFLKWEVTLGSQTQELGSQYANGYYVLASSWMHYQNVTFKAFFEAGNPDSTTVTYAVNDATMGAINPAPGTYTIYVGDYVTATATPNSGYSLSAWVLNFYSGTTLLTSDTIPSDDEDFANPMNFGSVPQSFADNNYSIGVVAIFEANSTPVTQYTVTLNTADATMGTVSPDGASTVDQGSSFTATATANTGYHFVAWMNGNTQASTANPYTFNVTGDITLTATFAEDSAEPCDVPTNLHVVENGVQNESIAIAWDANANVSSWNIRYRVTNGSWSSASSNTNSYTITGLTANTTYEIQVQANCGGGNLSDWSGSVTQQTTNVGIENHLDNSVVLFPNPAKEYVDIRVDGDLNVTLMEVYDVYGKLINTVNVIDNPTRINVSSLANGMYFVRVTTEAGAVTKTFVKR